ncbi:hypothetical protein [Haliea sp.]
MRKVFTALPQAETVEDIEALLPWVLKQISADIVTQSRFFGLY